MEYAACNVVYVDRTSKEDRLAKRRGSVPSLSQDALSIREGEHTSAARNVETLLDTFREVYICTSGKSCVSKLAELNDLSNIDLVPTLVLIDIPQDDSPEQLHATLRTPSPSSNRQVTDLLAPEAVDANFYGLSLLQWIVSDIQQHNLSRLVLPVALITVPGQTTSSIFQPELSRTRSADSSDFRGTSAIPLDLRQSMRYLDLGAVDVLTSPLLRDRLPSLAVHAYRAHKESRNDHRLSGSLKKERKRSWVGLDDQKPYAYLREAMVSGLMDGICRPSGEDIVPVNHVQISILPDRREVIEKAIGLWTFCAHDFSDDELLHSGILMLQHALAMPELEKWRIPTDGLTGFLVACRAAYNSFVPYHNFRHVIDVLQAIFFFLVQIGALPPYPSNSSLDESSKPKKSPIVSLLIPFDALTLLITAIGHDVGHPGVNNAFLVTLNAPLAQLYNDRSVLESFHCAAYSQILRRHWPVAFSGMEMRQLMISSILATDMGLHFDYMKKLGFLQEKLFENQGTDGWNGRLKEEYRTLACSLLIKCADISNVARQYDIAAQWTMILTDEFARQASMETDLGIPSALFAPPVREIIELGQSQIGFMNMFAIPLFQGVTDIMPAMQFCVDELNRNKAIWADKIEMEYAKQRKDSDDSTAKDGMLSPRHLSLGTSSDSSGHQRAGNSNGHSPKSAKFSFNNSRQRTASGLRNNSGDSANSDPSELRLTPKTLTDLPDDPSEDDPANTLPSPDLIPAAYSTATRQAARSAPSQLQLPYSTSSAPGLINSSNKEKSGLGNSLVTEVVAVKDESTSTLTHHSASDSKPVTGHRSSETTDSGNSGPGSNDWGSQATSATTNKMPLSPSTKGTSITSNDSNDRLPSSHHVASTSQPSASRSWPTMDSHLARDVSTDSGPDPKNGSVTIMESMRSLAKKPSRSRFRMHFWKKKHSGLDETPPLPMSGENGMDSKENINVHKM